MADHRLTELRRVAQRLRRDHERRDQLIREASENGSSRRQVAAAAGLSVGAVQQILRRLGVVALLALVLLVVPVSDVEAKHSWNGRYWAEQPIRVVDYAADRAKDQQRWRARRDEALAAWEASGVVRFRVHEKRGPRCKPWHGGFGAKAVGRIKRDFPDDQISLCQLVGGHPLMQGFTAAPRQRSGAIREAIVAVGSPNTLCHEIGHAIGLSHPRFDRDAKSCLGWGWRKPGVHDLEMLRLIYGDVRS